ncbi:MAG: ATP-binding protein [Anaerolineae bacterium]|nr:ATP-binding protein [Anaerolineae bacterium]
MQWLVTPPPGPSLTELIEANSAARPAEPNSSNSDSSSTNLKCPTCRAEPGTPGYVRYDVPKGHYLSGKAIPCPDCYEKVMAVRRRMTNRLEGWLASATLANFVVEDGNREPLALAKAFVEKPTGMLTFWGHYGRGKTHLLAGIYNALIERNILAAYYTLPDLTSRMRASVAEDSEAFYQYLSQFPVLLIDEINFADLRNWTREQVFRLLNRRYNTALPMGGDLERETGIVMAMNFNPNRDDTEYGWLFSRMKDEANTCVFVGGEDNRQRKSLLASLAKLARIK